MKIKIMYNGIKCDKTLITGRFYKKTDGTYYFIAKPGVAIQFINKLELDSYQEAKKFVEEMESLLGAEVMNDSDAMTDYFEDDCIYFEPNNPFYNEIETVITKKLGMQLPEARNAPTTSTVAPDAQEGPKAEERKAPEQSLPAETVALSDVIRKLEELFDLLNKLYFESKLARPVITVQSTPKSFGHCTTKKVWKTEGESYYEINIGAEFLNRPSEKTAATMCHEMIHLYCRENELKETCQGVRYHNKLFKEEAEKRELEAGYDRANGYTHTEPTEAFTSKLREEGYALEVPFARYTPEKEKAASIRNKPYTYSCGQCGQEVRSTADLNLICGNCEIPMLRSE